MTSLDQTLGPILKRWPIFAALASLAMLGIAHAFETFGHLAPCHLCLKQREVYWVAAAVAAAIVVLEATVKAWRWPSPRWLLAAIFLFGAGLAFFHAGVEWKWWPGPTTCTTGGVPHVNADMMKGILNGTTTSTAPMCDKAAWIFLGISMAGWNAVASLGLTALSAMAARRKVAA